MLSLEAEDATIEAAKKVADAALSAAQDMVNGATDLVNWSASDMSGAMSIASVGYLLLMSCFMYPPSAFVCDSILRILTLVSPIHCRHS